MYKLKNFLNWCSYLKISSREKGVTSFSPHCWFDGQKILIREIFKEVENNSPVRDFLILKARQLGVTTIVFAFDLFWIMQNPSVRFGFLCHNYEVRPKLRENFRSLYLNLPKSYKLPITLDNREMMHFVNGSEILFYHISSKEMSRQAVARSQSLTCIHATEAAYYDASDPNNEVLKSLQISRAKNHPARFTIIESTANGFNNFYDYWVNSKSNPSEKAIFIGWWSRNDYRISESNPLFQEYSYPLSREEKRAVNSVKHLYDYAIDMEQVAWFRNEIATTYQGDINFALQELPWTEDDAFRLSGYKFFDSQKLTQFRKEVEKQDIYYLNIYADINGIYLNEASKQKHNFEIYELPQDGEYYFLGADPSFGSSPDSDNAVVSIWKGYNDRIEQVAEYCDNSIGTIEFAKLLVFFSCFYRPSYLNLEVTGPGRVVIKELDKIKNNSFDIGEVQINLNKEVYDLEKMKINIRNIREYMYYRPDSLRRSLARHWETNQGTKEALMNQMKSIVGLGMFYPKSKRLIEEMNIFIRDGSYLGAESGRNDDRVIGGALAIEYWRTYWAHRLPKYEDAKKAINASESRKILEQTGLIQSLQPFINPGVHIPS
jgi:hypothetical protein